INPQTLTITIDKWLGLDTDADSLVVERVYPRKKISPVLISSGSKLKLDLKGYEMAIYEIFPMKEAQRPLLAGAIFSTSQTDNGFKINVLDVDKNSGGARFLNPQQFSNVQVDNHQMKADQVLLGPSPQQAVVQKFIVNQPNSHHL